MLVTFLYSSGKWICTWGLGVVSWCCFLSQPLLIGPKGTLQAEGIRPQLERH